MSNLIALPTGTELVGDYRIDRVLGAGGFGITYLADELALARPVTIKEYFPSDFAARVASHEAMPRSQDCSSDYRWGLDRFIEEAQTLARFDHPNIVRVYRYFRANNTGYMVLHFEEGQSLKAWLKGLGRAPRQKELDVLVAPLLDALEFVHKADYLHRDIAPDNIIIRKNGAPVLIDFGSARGEIAAHSKTVSALVKPGYSPYEQYAETSRQQGPWTDIYALGATLYHAVTGKRPPDAPSRMVHDEIVPAREAAISAYRAGFLKAIDRALSLDIKDRPQSIPIWRGELLAPEPARQGWLPRGEKKRAAEPKLPPAPADGLGSRDVPPHAPVTVPPPPDVPGGSGGLLDFMERLKGGGGSAGVPPIADGAPRPATARAGAGAAADSAVKTRPGAAAETPAGGKREPAPPKQPQKNEAKAQQAAKAAAAPAKSRQQAAAAVPSKALARAERPKPIKSSARRHLRPILVKLAIGAAIATVAVFIQNRLPDLKLPEKAAVETPQRSASARPPVTTVSARAPVTTSALQTPPPTPAPLPPIDAHAGGVKQIAFTANGDRIVSTGNDQTIKLWSTGSRTLSRIVPLDGGAPTALAIRGEEALVGHADGVVSAWDLSTSRKRGTFQRNEAAIWAIAPTGDGARFATAAHDWKIALWDGTSATTPLHMFEGHNNAVQALAFAPAGSLLASGSADKTVRLWSLNTLEMLRSYRGASDFITAVAISADGKNVAAASLDGSIRVWSTSSSRLKRRYTGHGGGVSSIAFSPDGTFLVTGGEDGTVRLWDLDRRRSVRAFAGHRGKVETVAFTPDGLRIASGGADGTIRLWDMPARQTASED